MPNLLVFPRAPFSPDHHMSLRGRAQAWIFSIGVLGRGITDSRSTAAVMTIRFFSPLSLPAHWKSTLKPGFPRSAKVEAGDN